MAKLTAERPQDPDAWTAYGVALYGAGRAGEAAGALQHSLALRPGERRALLFLALSKADLRDCQGALPELRRGFAEGQTDKLARLAGLSLMSCLATEKQTLEAVQVAAELRQRFGEDADVLYESAELYTRLWTETAGELIQKHPTSYRVHQLAAEVYEAQGNYDQAIREYHNALAEQPRLPEAHFRLGQLILRKGGEDADALASTEFRTELQGNPGSAVSALALAEIERHANQLDAAGADYSLALHLDPALTEARTGYARVLLAQGKPALAERELHQVLQEKPEDAQAHYALMLTLRQQGHTQEAAAEMETFKRLQAQSSSQFQQNLGALLTGSKGPGTEGATYR